MMPNNSIKIRRFSKHNRARIFSALTEPDKMAQWFFGMKSGNAKVSNDLRPGGEYHIQMYDDKDACNPHGTYLEISPPERLVFTWTSEACPIGSKVIIDLFERESGTEMVLTHELPQSLAGDHQAGWGNCLDHLEEYLNLAAESDSGKNAPAT